jgi:dihydropyrimidinase
MLWTEGVCTGKLDIHRFVDCASTETAKVFGLFPRKGTISVGADADIVIWDPKYRGKISARTHHMNVDYNPYEGKTIKGRPARVLVRGSTVAKNGSFTGQLGHGRFLKRTPNHF